MPQMAPLNWLSLLIFFSMIFFIYNSFNFFIFNYKFEKNLIKKNKLFFNWKW